ncbi:hypothetical protein ACFE04_025593 [Oxalis oulophora]
MEVLLSSSATYSSTITSRSSYCSLTLTTSIQNQLQVLSWRPLPLKTVALCIARNVDSRYYNKTSISRGPFKRYVSIQPIREFSSLFGLFRTGYGCLVKLIPYPSSFKRRVGFSDNFRHDVSRIFFNLAVAAVLVTSVSVTISTSPSWALSEENRLFLEAWRTIDRAYIDKTFNGQSWFRYREDALRNEPMNTREETYNAIKKMVASLDDPFTRFLEPEKFNSLRSGTRGSITGVGLSIGYPTEVDGTTGLLVISAAPGGPANRAGVLSGDIILQIDNTSTQNMGIYDAADLLQGPEGSSVQLTVRSGPEVKHFALTREKVTINPVKSRLCEVPSLGKENPRIGYIKLSTFNQNASAAVREAIDSLRSNNVNAFVLDLRDNSGGLFPEGVEIAKIWNMQILNFEDRLDKGVIVYICDNRGVRDIYDTDGSNAIAVSEPLAVLVNKGTASASEILAGALKDNKRAVGVIPDHPLPTSFPKDDDTFCGCLQDTSAACYINRAQLFAR